MRCADRSTGWGISVSDRFSAAAEALYKLHDDAHLTRPVLDVVPVTGASISTIGEFLGPETISSSDSVAARLDELQFDLGEGPCWDALSSAGPVLVPDIRDIEAGLWPAFARAISSEGVGAIFAFPLAIGPLRIGAMDLYSAEPGELSSEYTEQSMLLADIVSRRVLRRALRLAGAPEYAEDNSRHSRRSIHQAVGFVIAQLGISPEDAQLLIQGHAFGEGRSMREVAEDILERRLTFTASASTIGDVR